MSRTASTKTPGPLCVVTIGVCNEYLMPAADGLKVVQLFQKSQRVERTYVQALGGYRYTLGGPADVEWRGVQAHEVHQPADTAATPARRRAAPLALPAPEAP